MIKMIEVLVKWLHNHSTSIVRKGSELQFLHSTGSTSILVTRDKWIDGIIPVRNDELASFYAEYWGGSIGNGQIIIGTPIPGGVEVSHGFRLPDLQKMETIAISLGMTIPPDLQIFMMQGSWLFSYGVRDASNLIFRYDFDFREFTQFPGVEEILDQWSNIS